MSLSCGGRGPCCHIGYAHRHCEHCDVVVPITVQPHTHGWSGWYGTPWWNQIYPNSTLGGQINGLSGLANQFQLLQGGLNVTEVPVDAGEQRTSS